MCMPWHQLSTDIFNLDKTITYWDTIKVVIMYNY